MRKRILSLLLCIMLCLSLMPTTAFAATKLETPSNLHWDGSEALWDHVENASYNYLLTLYKDETKLFDCFAGQNYGRDFAMDMAKYGEGKYTFTVTALAKEGSDFIDSDESSMSPVFFFTDKMDTPTGLKWDNYSATWDAVADATIYEATLLKNGESCGRVTSRTCVADLSELITHNGSGTYTFSVVAYGPKLESNPAESPSKTINITPLPAPANLHWDGTLALWDHVENASYNYLLTLYKDGTKLFDCFAGQNYGRRCDTDMAKYGEGEYTFTVQALPNKGQIEYGEGIVSPHSPVYSTYPSGTVKISFDANGGGGTMDAVMSSVGKFVLPECAFNAPANKKFYRWYVEKAVGSLKVFDPGQEVDVASSVTVQALWINEDVDTYTLTFASGDHGNGSLPSTTVQNGDTFTLPENTYTPDVGYEFLYWNTGYGVYKHPGETITVTANKTITAMWKLSNYTVNVTTDGNGYAGANITTGTFGREVTLSSTPKSGYHFKEWQVISGGVTVTDNKFTIGTSNVEIMAIFESNESTTYTVSFEMNDHGDQIATQTVKEGEMATKPTDPTAEGWTFDGWYADATFSVTFDFTAPITADTTVYANWTKNSVTPPVPTTYTVSFNMNGHGTQVTAQTVKEGEMATKPTDPTAEGWTFGGWYADATFNVAFDFNTAVTADTTVYAKWTENTVPQPPVPTTYTVSFNMNGHGTQVADQTVEDGSKATKPADPTADEYSFGGWYKDADCTVAWDFDTDTVSSDITLYAKWEQFEYKMLDGADSEWTKGSGVDLMFRSEAPIEKFVSVRVDGKVVDPSNYTATEGSTRITFRASYLETLTEDLHKLEIVSKDGKAATSFRILAKSNPSPNPNPNPDIPKTGDTSNIALWTKLLIVSGCAFGLIMFLDIKKKKQIV